MLTHLENIQPTIHGEFGVLKNHLYIGWNPSDRLEAELASIAVLLKFTVFTLLMAPSFLHYDRPLTVPNFQSEFMARIGGRNALFRQGYGRFFAGKSVTRAVTKAAPHISWFYRSFGILSLRAHRIQGTNREN